MEEHGAQVEAHAAPYCAAAAAAAIAAAAAAASPLPANAAAACCGCAASLPRLDQPFVAGVPATRTDSTRSPMGKPAAPRAEKEHM